MAHLRSTSHVVHTYSAAAIDKILIMKQPGTNNVPLVNQGHIAPIAQELLTGLFGAFALQGKAVLTYITYSLMMFKNVNI